MQREMWWTLNKVVLWLTSASSLQSSAVDLYFSFPQHISGSESLDAEAHQHADERIVVIVYPHTSVPQLHHWHHGACVHYYTAVTAPTVFWSASRRFHLSEFLCVCCQCCVCVVGSELRFHNWVCCKVSKVINVSHQASHLSRPTALLDNEVRESWSVLLPVWRNWEAQVSA